MGCLNPAMVLPNLSDHSIVSFCILSKALLTEVAVTVASLAGGSSSWIL